MGAHALAYYVSDQNNSLRGNIGVNDYDGSQSFETPRENNQSSFLGVIQSPQRPRQINPKFLHL